MKTLKAAAIVGLILVTALYIQNGWNHNKILNKAKAIQTVLAEAPKEEMEIGPPRAIPIVEVKVAKELLPENEFVTLIRVKEVTPDGVKAIAEGTKVTKMGERNGKILISDSKVTLEALASEITNDKELADSFLAKALANKPAGNIPILPDSPVPLVQPKEEVIIKKDYSAHIAAVEKQIKNIEDRIRDLKYSRRGAISGNGALIARLEIELKELESQKFRLIQAQN